MLGAAVGCSTVCTTSYVPHNTLKNLIMQLTFLPTLQIRSAHVVANGNSLSALLSLGLKPAQPQMIWNHRLSVRVIFISTMTNSFLLPETLPWFPMPVLFHHLKTLIVRYFLAHKEHSALSQHGRHEPKHMCTFSADVTMTHISFLAPASLSACAIGKLILPKSTLSQPLHPRYSQLLPLSSAMAPFSSSLSDMGH